MSGAAEKAGRREAAADAVSWVESLPPGLGHIRRGHRVAGLRFFAFFLFWSAAFISAIQRDKFGELLERGLKSDLLGLFMLIALPAALVWLSHVSLRNLVAPPERDGMGTWELAWQHVRKNQRAVWGMTLLAFLYSASFLAAVIAPYPPNDGGAGGTKVHKNQPPGSRVLIVAEEGGREIACLGMEIYGNDAWLDRAADEGKLQHFDLDSFGTPKRGWSRGADKVRYLPERIGHKVPFRTEYHALGTDSNGRDLLSRLLYGSQISLMIGFVAMFVAVSLGVLFGSLAGYFGGWIDSIIMRLVDILLAFPRLLLLLLIVSVYEGAGIMTVIVILGATGWMGVSRLVRAEFLKLKRLDYAQAAKSLGFGQARIMFRHLLPNSMAPVIVNATLLVGNTILVEAGLSFLGFGVKPPDASWGNIIADGQGWLREAWWISTIPGLLIVFAVVCINLVGDALRDALDPKTH
jgi:peptide/nickel transport system permease protein